MEKDLQIIKESKLFCGIQEKDIEQVLSFLSAEKRCYKKEETIFRAGDRITLFALLLEGSVHIQREDYWGNLSILNKISKGEIFGEAYAASGSAILNNVIAAENCAVLFLDFSRILHANAFPYSFCFVLIQNIFTLLAEKNRLLAQKIGHMSKRTTREKLLSYLSEQSVKAASPSFDIPFNRQQLADFLSVDRSAMSNELCKMRLDGLLQFHKNHFLLTKKSTVNP